MKRSAGGFTLFEVMIAMAICVAGLALILQMLGTSETLSRRAETHLQAQQHCRNLLNVFLAGIEEPRESRQESLAADENFWYSVQLSKHPLLPLEVITVEVWPKSPQEREGLRTSSDSKPTEPNNREALRFSLVGHRPLPGRESGSQRSAEDAYPNNLDGGAFQSSGSGSRRLP